MPFLKQKARYGSFLDAGPLYFSVDARGTLASQSLRGAAVQTGVAMASLRVTASDMSMEKMTPPGTISESMS